MAISAGLERSGPVSSGLMEWAAGLEPVEFLLVREKATGAGELVQACRQIRAVVPPGTRVLVAGGRVDIALAAGLDGVHLGAHAGGLRVSQVKTLFPSAFITVSCHDPSQVREAREEGASAVLFAPVFGKWVDGVEVVGAAGLEALGAACREAKEMPVFALGGVTARNAEACLRAGAAGVAGIRMFSKGAGGMRE